MSSFRRPAPCLSRAPGALPRLGAAVLAVLIGAVSSTPIAAADKSRELKSAKAAKQASKSAKNTKGAKTSKDPRGAKVSTASKAAVPPRPASAPAGSEAADIAELRARQAAGEVLLMRRHTVDDLAIEVWSTGLPRRFYVAVSQQGLLRRTLTSADETQAWRSFDTFRRMAAAGEVGRPVLLGQLPLAGAAALDAAALDTPPAHTAGQEVATLRRERIGDELARLVWDAGASEYVVSLTRQGVPVAMQRSPDAVVATRVYEDFVRQAESRAALLPADQGR